MSNDRPGEFHVRDVRGRRYAVASGHETASAEALRVLRSGGNIVDAAIAGAAVLSVVLPYACGIGGDLYVLYYNASTGELHGLNGTGTAPDGAVPGRFRQGLPETGIEAATVPGTVAGWEDMVRRFGTRSLRELLQPAIRLAYEGFPAHLGLLENCHEKASLLLGDAEATRLFMPGGRPFAEGEIVVQTDLGRSLDEIAQHGAAEFYEGGLAARFVDGLQRMGGLFSGKDLARHESLWQTPLRTSFYGHEVITMPPNSVGVSLLLQLLALEASGVGALDPGSLAFWRQTISAWRWARTTCADAVGEPEEAVARAEDLLRRFSGDGPRLPGFHGSPVAPPASGDTSNIVIMDAEGNAVSLVQSVSAPFASGVVVPGTGILLNNRMRGFNAVEGSVNCVGPRRRPAHTLVPVMVARDDRVRIALGTPGAAGQTVTLAQFLARVLALGQDVATAIDEPRWSVGLSGHVMVERHAPPAIMEGLATEPNLEIADMRHVRFGSVKVALGDGESVRAVADYRRVAEAYAE